MKVLILFEMRSDTSVSGLIPLAERRRPASRLAFSSIKVRTSFMRCGFSAKNSCSLRISPARTSREEQMTPPLFAELSLMMRTPFFSSSDLASGVR